MYNRPTFREPLKRLQTASRWFKQPLQPASAWLLVLLLISGTLTACGGGDSNAGHGPPASVNTAPAGGNAGGNKDVKSQPANTPSSQVQTLKLALAKELLDAGTNPFLSKLPIIVDAKLDAKPSAVADVPAVDPFEGVALLGVVYNPDNAVALVSLPQTIGGGATTLVKAGDMLTSGGSQLKVTKVARDRVDIQEVAGGKALRTFFLPDIVGYQAGAKNGGAVPVSRKGVGSSDTPPLQNDSNVGRALQDLVETRRLKPGESNRENLLNVQEPDAPPQTKSSANASASPVANKDSHK